MFVCNRHETRAFSTGAASGVVRKGECNHVVGDTLTLVSKYIDGSDNSVKFGTATVLSVRPGTIGKFRKDGMIAEMDGYPNCEVWFGTINQMYSGMLSDGDQAYHLKLKIDSIDNEDSEEVVTPVTQDPSIEYIETIDDHGIKTRIPAPTN